MEDSSIVGKKLHLTKSEGSQAGKPWALKSGGGGLSLGALQKFTPMVLNSNLPPILHRFRGIAFDRSKIAIFGYPYCV